MNILLKKVLLAAAFLICAALVIAQSAVDGAIGGTVEDTSGSVIPGATVVVRSNTTNAEQTVVADAAGFFRAIHLQPSIYTVTITAPGFQSFRSDNVVVQVGLLTIITARLPVGGTEQTVEVSAQMPMINSTSPDFAGLIDRRVLMDLPVNNYRWSSYAALTPGVVIDTNGFGLLSFRGQSTLLNNVTIDGADDNQAYFSEERGRTRAGYSTAKASVQEFQVNTSNYTSEYGRAAGGVVNSITRSGGNAFHGELYFFDRDASWGAANAFTTRQVQLTPGGPFVAQNFKPKDVRKQYGGAIGGPIFKDRLFFFFAGDRFDRNFPGTAVASNPSSFFALPDAALPAGKTCGVTTGAAAPSTIDAGACTLQTNLGLSSYGAAATAYTNGLSGLNTMLGPVPRKGQQTIFFPKIDWQINSRHHASFEVNRLRWGSPAGIQTQTTNTFGIASFGNDYVRVTFGIAKLDSILTSSISNEIRYQYGRDFEFEFAQPPTAYEQTYLVGPTGAGYKNPFGGPPSVTITNGFTFGIPNFLNRAALPDERRWQIADTVNWIHGSHNIKFGVDFLHTNDLINNLFSGFGVYSYSTLPTYFTDFYRSQSATISGPAPLRNYSSYTQGIGIPGLEFQTMDYAFFVEDNWKVNRRLALTAGLRYEYESLPSAVGSLVGSANGAAPGTGFMPSNKSNIGPRVGFAYDVFGGGKTILRGGYGMFFARILNGTIYNALINTGSLNGQPTFSYTTSTAGAPAFPQVAASFTAAGAPNAVFFDRNFKAPQIHQTTLTVEQDLGWNTAATISWLGSFGRRMANFVDTNLNSPITVSYNVIDTSGQGPLVPGSTFTSKFYPKTTQPTSVCFSQRPNCAFGSITNIFSGVNSNYQGLVGQVNHRFSSHVQFSFNYTWSHALDFGQNNQTQTTANNLLDPQDLRGEYGNSIQNVTNRLVANGIFTLPSNYKGWQAWLLNDWEVAPSFALQSGLPYSIASSGTLSTAYIPGGNRSAIGGGVNGSNATTPTRIPGFQRNGFTQPRTNVLDLRLSKRFTIHERLKLELLGESFNILNKQNVTAVNTTGYFIGNSGPSTNPTGNTLTFNTSNANPLQPLFGSTTNTNSSGFSFSPRQIQIGIRAQF